MSKQSKCELQDKAALIDRAHAGEQASAGALGFLLYSVLFETGFHCVRALALLNLTV